MFEKHKKFRRDMHLKQYLQDEYCVKIIKKYNSFLLIDNNDTLIDFFQTMSELKQYLSVHPELKVIE